MSERIKKELELLQRYYPQAEWHEHGESGWLRIQNFHIHAAHWSRDIVTVCFQVPLAGYPGAAPYAFYVEGGLRLKGTDTRPQSYEEPSATPFPGTWGRLSWQQDGTWRPTTDLTSGSNLANFVQSFQDRFKERD